MQNKTLNNKKKQGRMPNSMQTKSHILYYTSLFTTTLHHLLLPFSIHQTLLPFNNYSYPSSFTTTLHHSLLPFIMHYYPSSFTITLHHSLLPLYTVIHYYTSSEMWELILRYSRE